MTSKADKTVRHHRRTQDLGSLAMSTTSPSRSRPGIVSPEIASISLHNPRPYSLRIYTLLAGLYPALYYAYYHAYDTYIQSEEWTFVYCVGLGLIHALSFLITKWSKAASAKLECTAVRHSCSHPPNSSDPDASPIGRFSGKRISYQSYPQKGQGQGRNCPITEEVCWPGWHHLGKERQHQYSGQRGHLLFRLPAGHLHF